SPREAEPRDGRDRGDGRVRAAGPPRRRLPRAGAPRGAHHRRGSRRRGPARSRPGGRRGAGGRGHPGGALHRSRARAARRGGGGGRGVTVVTAAEMRALDRWTIGHGTPGHVLMERAGAGAARVLREHLRRPRGRAIVICGRGNNGGDGFVVARHLRRAGVPVEVWLAARADEVGGDAARMLAAWRRGRGRVHELTAAGATQALGRRLAEAAVVVDALFGTGLNAPVTGLPATVIELVNACG